MNLCFANPHLCNHFIDKISLHAKIQHLNKPKGQIMADLEIVRFRDPNTLKAVKAHKETKDAFITEVQPGLTVVSLGLTDYESYNSQQYGWQKYDARGIHSSRGMCVIYMPHNIKGSRASDIEQAQAGSYHIDVARTQQEMLDSLPNLESLGLKWVLPRAAEVIQIFRNHVLRHTDPNKMDERFSFWGPTTKIPWGFDWGDVTIADANMCTVTTDRLLCSGFNCEWQEDYVIALLRNNNGVAEDLVQGERSLYGFVGVFPIGVPVEVLPQPVEKPKLITVPELNARKRKVKELFKLPKKDEQIWQQYMSKERYERDLEELITGSYKEGFRLRALGILLAPTFADLPFSVGALNPDSSPESGYAIKQYKQLQQSIILAGSIILYDAAEMVAYFSPLVEIKQDKYSLALQLVYQCLIPFLLEKVGDPMYTELYKLFKPFCDVYGSKTADFTPLKIFFAQVKHEGSKNGVVERIHSSIEEDEKRYQEGNLLEHRDLLRDYVAVLIEAYPHLPRQYFDTNESLFEREIRFLMGVSERIFIPQRDLDHVWISLRDRELRHQVIRRHCLNRWFRVNNEDYKKQAQMFIEAHPDDEELKKELERSIEHYNYLQEIEQKRRSREKDEESPKVDDRTILEKMKLPDKAP